LLLGQFANAESLREPRSVESFIRSNAKKWLDFLDTKFYDSKVLHFVIGHHQTSVPWDLAVYRNSSRGRSGALKFNVPGGGSAKVKLMSSGRWIEGGGIISRSSNKDGHKPWHPPPRVEVYGFNNADTSDQGGLPSASTGPKKRRAKGNGKAAIKSGWPDPQLSPSSEDDGGSSNIPAQVTELATPTTPGENLPYDQTIFITSYSIKRRPLLFQSPKVMCAAAEPTDLKKDRDDDWRSPLVADDEVQSDFGDIDVERLLHAAPVGGMFPLMAMAAHYTQHRAIIRLRLYLTTSLR
jgi:hypothetical protein